MTEIQAINELDYLLGYENAIDKGYIEEENHLNSEEKEALKIILDEIRQYRAIGTVEEFKALKEKNEPKKPRFYAHNYHCTECGSLVGNNEFQWQRFLYCDNCGQKLDWKGGAE